MKTESPTGIFSGPVNSVYMITPGATGYNIPH